MRSFVLPVALAATLLGCDKERHFSLVPTFADCIGGTAVNQVYVTTLGDYAFDPANVTSSAPMGQLSLAVRMGSKVVQVEGFENFEDGPRLIGRTAPLDLEQVAGPISIAYGPPNGLCPTNGSLVAARAQHRATLLGNGTVLLSGGVDAEGNGVTVLERYLPQGDGSTAAGNFAALALALDSQATLGHSATRLDSGGVLLAGGVAVAGGRPKGPAYQSSYELSQDGNLVVEHRLRSGPPVGDDPLGGGGGRAFHSATRLDDGRVILTGGCRSFQMDGSCAASDVLASTVEFNTQSGFTVKPEEDWLRHARWGHEAILRGDGTLLILGGRGADGTTPDAEIFDPNEPRPSLFSLPGGGAAQILPGSTLVAGGDTSAAERAFLFSGDSSFGLSDLRVPRLQPSVTALEDGSVLVAGGSDAPAPLVLYDAAHFASEGPAFAGLHHTATRLQDGTVLLTGGMIGTTPSGQGSVFVHSLLGPYSKGPILLFEPGETPMESRRPDRGFRRDGQYVLTTATPSSSRPAEVALVAGIRPGAFTLSALLSVDSGTVAALVLAYASEGNYLFVQIEPGMPTVAHGVRRGSTGPIMTAELCRGEVVRAEELPTADLDPASWKLILREGCIELHTATRRLMSCLLAQLPEAGAVGVGVLRGTLRVQSLQVER